MGINVKNPVIEDKIRAYAEGEGLGLTEAIGHAIDAAQKAKAESEAERQRKIEELWEFISKQPPADITSDHSDLYDENGM